MEYLNPTKRTEFLIFFFIIILISGAGILIHHSWRSFHLTDSRENLQKALSPQELVTWLDIQIENTKLKLKQLDPGPPPAWYQPSYYYKWLPRAKLYNEVQETFISLQKQKRILKEKGYQRMQEAGKVWNIGVAPIFHFLLGVSLLMLSIRWILRMVLIKGLFGWSKL